MDDGYSHYNGIVLCTESFTFNEIDLLRNMLINKFNFLVTLQVRNTSGGKKSHRISISSKSRDKLISLVKPYFIPSIALRLYKLGL
jgi:hypothetical protein